MMRDEVPVPFLETTRSLSLTRRGNTLAVVLSVVVLVLWAVWTFLARVGVYETSRTARLEVPGATPVEAPISGAVAENRMALGKAVRAGDTLLAIDVAPRELELDAQQVALAGTERQLASARRELETLASSLRHVEAAWRLATRQAELELEMARAAAEEARADAEVLRRLHDEGIGSSEELRHAEAELERRGGVVEQLGTALHRLGEEQTAARRQREAELARLEASVRELETRQRRSEARVRALRHEIDRHVLRAPVDGRIGELAELDPGRYLGTGTRVCTIVPDGAPQVVASFDAASLGRIRSGQRARLRLDGFPSTRFGAIDAEVREVGGEVRDGGLRVELLIADDRALPVELGHGYPGIVEIESERVSPLTLLLRYAGRRVRARPES